MEKMLVVTDKNITDSEQFSSSIITFLHALAAQHELSWELLNGDDFTFCDGGDAVTQADQRGVLLGMRTRCQAEQSEGSEEKRKRAFKRHGARWQVGDFLIGL